MKKTLKFTVATLLLFFPVVALLVTPFNANADAVTVTQKIENPIKYDNFSDFVAAVTQTAVKVLMPFVVLSFIYSGFLFVKAQGNEAELKTAKEYIKWSIVGAFILFGAWGFAEIIKTTLSSITNA